MLLVLRYMDFKDCGISAYDATSKLYLQSHGNVVLHYQSFSFMDLSLQD